MPQGVLNDISGKRFARFAVLCRAPNSRRGKTMWECRCDCGQVRIVEGYNLKHGNTRSCGCLSVERPNSYKHGHAPSSGVSPEYRSWSHMVDRCTNPGANDFARYGGRGITVCEPWANSFDAFIRDMGHRPSPAHSLDRVDNSRGYEPSNCRWATQIEQARNKRNNIWIEFRNERRMLLDWAERLSLRPTLIRDRIYRGITDPERLLARPQREQST